MAKKGASQSGSGKGRAKERSQRAASNAAPTPADRLRWPKALESRLKAAGIVTNTSKKPSRRREP